MKIIVWLLFPIFLFSQSYGLKILIENAGKTNGLIRAKEMQIKAKNKEIDAEKSMYWPTIDIGGSYHIDSPNSIVSPGRTASGYASINFDLYDGGRKNALLRGKGYEYESSLFEKQAFEKSITLQIVQYYFDIKKIKAALKSLLKRSAELKVQIQRIQKFYRAGLSTNEEIDKLQAVYDNNNYVIANTKLALQTSQEHLKLISGLDIKALKRNYFLEPKHIKFEFFDNIKMLQSSAKAVNEKKNALDAGYMPQVKFSDTYQKSHFSDMVSLPGFNGDGFLIDHQNKVSVSVNLRLFDKGRIKNEGESIRYKKLSILSKIEQAKKEQKMNFKLAYKSLQTTKIKLKSAKSALNASNSTYIAIRKKFEAGIVDNIAFLDALTEKIFSQARYKETIYDYEIKKSIYYYYAGKDPKEFIK